MYVVVGITHQAGTCKETKDQSPKFINNRRCHSLLSWSTRGSYSQMGGSYTAPRAVRDMEMLAMGQCKN